jgi:hypothetical protein
MTISVDMPGSRPERNRAPLLWEGWLADTVSGIYLVSALGLWVVSLQQIDVSRMTDFGLASVLPVHHWAALGLLAIGFTLSLSSRSRYMPMSWLHLLALIAILHLTQSIVYEAARYSWAWKHIGIIDFIERHGRVEESIRFLPAYHNWPGFFFVGAWVAKFFEASPIDIARAVRFVPPISNTLYLLALIPLYRALNRDIRQILLACWIFIAGNWIGQDYFSPQGTVYFFYLLLLGLCLTVLSPIPFWARFPGSRFRAVQFVAGILWRDGPPSPAPARPAKRIAATLAAFALILATTATHQLTPIMIILALTGLTVIGRLSPILVVFATLAELTWLLYMATPFVADHLAEEINVFGEGLIQASERLIDTSIVTEGMYWVVLIGRVTTLSIALLAVAGAIRRCFNGFFDVRAATLLAAPIPLLANAYGGEVIFRVYYFALPFLAFFAASLFFPAPGKGDSVVSRTLIAIVAAGLTVGFVFANNGKDRQYSFTHDEIEAAQWLYQNAPQGSLLIEGARSYPSQFQNYERYIYLPIANEVRSERQRIIDDPVNIFAGWLSDPKANGGYVIITRSQKAYVYSEGVMPMGSLDAIEQKLLASPRFNLVYSSENTKIFTLHPTIGKMGIPGA